MNRTARVLELLAGIVSLASGVVLLDKLTDGWVSEQWERRTEPARRYALCYGTLAGEHPPPSRMPRRSPDAPGGSEEIERLALFDPLNVRMPRITRRTPMHPIIPASRRLPRSADLVYR